MYLETYIAFFLERIVFSYDIRLIIFKIEMTIKLGSFRILEKKILLIYEI